MQRLRKNKGSTDFPAYCDTGKSDTPVTVTVLSVPNLPFVYQKDVVGVTLAYSDTFLSSRGCHCKRGLLYVPPSSERESSSSFIVTRTSFKPFWVLRVSLWSHVQRGNKYTHMTYTFFFVDLPCFFLAETRRKNSILPLRKK